MAPLSRDLYRYLLDKHLFAFAELDLDEITAPRVREWRAERLRITGAKTITAKAYRLLKAIMAALIYQHSDDDRQQEVAAGLDATVRKARQEAAAVPDDPPDEPDDQRSGTNLARDR